MRLFQRHQGIDRRVEGCPALHVEPGPQGDTSTRFEIDGCRRFNDKIRSRLDGQTRSKILRDVDGLIRQHEIVRRGTIAFERIPSFILQHLVRYDYQLAAGGGGLHEFLERAVGKRDVPM